MIDTSRYIKEADIRGDSQEDTKLLRDMAKEARTYLNQFSWCPPIRKVYLAAGIGGIVAIFLVEFSRSINGIDDRLWVINGDIPSAYLVTEAGETPQEALHTYYDLMQEWVDAIKKGFDLASVFPVAAKPTLDNAVNLERRLNSLREEIEPSLFQP